MGYNKSIKTGLLSIPIISHFPTVKKGRVSKNISTQSESSVRFYINVLQFFILLLSF